MAPSKYEEYRDAKTPACIMQAGVRNEKKILINSIDYALRLEPFGFTAI